MHESRLRLNHDERISTCRWMDGFGKQHQHDQRGDLLRITAYYNELKNN